MFIFCQLTLDRSRVTLKAECEKSILLNKNKQLIIICMGWGEDLSICENNFPMTRTTLIGFYIWLGPCFPDICGIFGSAEASFFSVAFGDYAVLI